jgi:hypothetical protein
MMVATAVLGSAPAQHLWRLGQHASSQMVFVPPSKFPGYSLKENHQHNSFAKPDSIFSLTYTIPITSSLHHKHTRNIDILSSSWRA